MAPERSVKSLCTLRITASWRHKTNNAALLHGPLLSKHGYQLMTTQDGQHADELLESVKTGYICSLPTAICLKIAPHVRSDERGTEAGVAVRFMCELIARNKHSWFSWPLCDPLLRFMGDQPLTIVQLSLYEVKRSKMPADALTRRRAF
jgi:hypothetical protein